jgi:hypothetical protein
VSRQSSQLSHPTFVTLLLLSCAAPQPKLVWNSSAHPSEKQSAKKTSGQSRSTTWVPASLLGFKNAPSLSLTRLFNTLALLTTVTIPLLPITPDIEILKNKDRTETSHSQNISPSFLGSAQNFTTRKPGLAHSIYATMLTVSLVGLAQGIFPSSFVGNS